MKSSVKDPDAFILGDVSEPLGVVESGGKYDAERIVAFHEHCVGYGLSLLCRKPVNRRRSGSVV